MAKKKVKSKPKVAIKPTGIESDSISSDATNSDVVTSAFSASAQSVFLKLCRLCESKDGPFLNIFDADKIIAKKIEELMPFGIAENDDLPHKICFRCSAKVEELHEFIQKCIKTQESLRKAMGKIGTHNHKTKTRTAWEEKLIKTNMSNDDICDALIKKAMEGIKNIPMKPFSATQERKELTVKRTTRNSMESPVPQKESNPKDTTDAVKDGEQDALPVRRTRSSKVDATNSNNHLESTNELKRTDDVKANPTTLNSFSMDFDERINNTNIQSVPKTKLNVKEKPALEKEKLQETNKPELENQGLEKTFNIMDHVSMIKVTGVGILFQCKLCNRNFVKKEVVESHNCAKNGVPKIDFSKILQTPAEVCKAPTVKYIKMDTNLKKALVDKSSKPEDSKSELKESNKTTHEDILPAAPPKPKPRIGPASKVKKQANEPDPPKDLNKESNSTSLTPSFLLPHLPSANGRYRLVPGPNNTFTLLEDTLTSQANPPPQLEKPQAPIPESNKVLKKRKATALIETVSEVQCPSKNVVLDSQNKSQPYPVGLFQTVAHHSRLYEPPETAPEPTAFMTPAMKKQSYTVVQTGNPSKLLISTKAQGVDDIPLKKRQKKTKTVVAPEAQKDPYKVTLEDAAPPKDSGFFTFINVDPLLQPSYVLPTDSIIQESQISTSTPATSKVVETEGKYCCNMCGENFTREKKLLAHIKSHYTQMDEEDFARAEKAASSKKKHK